MACLLTKPMCLVVTTALCLIAMLTVSAACVCVRAAYSKDGESVQDIVARNLPLVYSKDFNFVYGNVNGKRFGIVCAEPSPAPTPTHTPPYIRLFLVDIHGSDSRVVWDTELVPDNVCVDLALHASSRLSYVVSVVSRPYSGSVAKYHLRLYRYRSGVASLVHIQSVSYTDGVAIALSSVKSGPPAFLIYEPIYGDRPKLQRQPYKFRLYVPTKDGSYTLKLTLMTQSRHKIAVSAYKEIAPKLRHSMGSYYKLPKSVPEVAQIEQNT